MQKDKPKISPDGPASNPPWKISDKESLVNWVGEFLWYWEGSDMLSTEAAIILVNEIIKAQRFLEDERKKDVYQSPTPQSYFPTRV